MCACQCGQVRAGDQVKWAGLMSTYIEC